MTIQYADFVTISGQTLTAKMFPEGSDTEVTGNTFSITERTNDKGTYRVSITRSAVESGTRKITLFNGTTPVATGLRVFAGVDGEVGRSVNPFLDETFAELSAPPAATSSLKDKITWVFQWLKNKSTQSATQRNLYADDGTTVISTETVSDDGTTYTKGEQS
jgi:hypothetical protein